jgi:uncharacterized membrane protein YfcA
LSTGGGGGVGVTEVGVLSADPLTVDAAATATLNAIVATTVAAKRAAAEKNLAPPVRVRIVAPLTLAPR